MDAWRFDLADPALGQPLQGSYDPLLVALSLVIACLSALAAFQLADRMVAAPSGTIKAWWHAGGATAMGCGIWAMHFTAMLAFSLEELSHLHYGLGLTVASIVPAILGSAAALYLMARPRVEVRDLLKGSLLMAIGIGSMHYLGMEAMRMEGLRYSFPLFVLSILVAFLLALAALFLHFRVRRLPTLSESGLRMASAGFMGCAVAGMHYTAMEAALFYDVARFEAGDVTHEDGLPEGAMAAAIGSFAGLILGLSLMVAWVDRQKSIQRMLKHLANTDTLTGLPNRACFQQLLEGALSLSKRHGGSLAVFFMDLNDFKSINDSLGHATGDRVLKEFAARVASILRSNDVVARFGGDEFVVLAHDLVLPEEAVSVSQRILHTMDQPIEFDNWKLHARPSIGISFYPDDGDQAESLIKHADAAMYQAKSSELGYQMYDRAMTEGAMLRVRLGHDLRDALKRGTLYLQYQPLVDLSTGDWVGLEALARWRHPEEGEVSPSIFVPLAERSGLILQLGRWALMQACRQGRIWKDAGLEFGRIGVNLSAFQLARSDFVSDLKHILEVTGMPAECLALELTESSLVEPERDIIERLLEMRDMGVSLAIDDFGTGYSSLSYLKNLPVDTLKIDRSFVKEAQSDPRDQAIIRAVAGMGSSLGFTVLAEGVETEQQAQLVLQLGCRFGQGFFFASPANVDAITAALSLYPRHGDM